MLFRSQVGQAVGIAGGRQTVYTAALNWYVNNNVRFMLPEPSDKVASIGLLLEPRYRRATLASWAAAFCVLFGIFGLTGWVPTVMLARGESFAASFGFGALIQGMAFIGSLICGAIADKTHKPRVAISAWWLGGAFSLAMLALVNVHTLNFFFIGLAGFCILGAQNVLNNFTASIYDTEVRGTGVGMMLGVGRLGGILGPYTTGWVQQITGGSVGLFAAIAVAVLCGASFILLARTQETAKAAAEELVAH